jgi:hypothetical protein
MNIAFDRPPAASGSTVWTFCGQAPIQASRQSAAAEWFEKTGLPAADAEDARSAWGATQSAKAAAAFTLAR